MFETVTAIINSFFPNVQALYLFGSYGTEFETIESDIDLAILLPHCEGKILASNHLDECTASLAQELGRQIDLINLRKANTVFQRQILETSQIIASPDPFARQVFEMLVLSFYQKLQDERKTIIDQIKASGRIF